MKGIYLVRNNSLANGDSGIAKKIKMQINAFKKLGIDCRIAVQKTGLSNKNILSKLIYALPFSNVNPKWSCESEFRDIDFLYLRRPIFMSYFMRVMMRNLKKNNMKAKIIMEIPSYPYDREYRKLKERILLIKDKYNRKKLSHLVDLFVYIGDPLMKQELWGVKAVQMMNGIDLTKVQTVIPLQHKSINLVCISSCEYWHGYERLIRGLINYFRDGSYGCAEVNLHIVGDGPELMYYQEIAQQSAVHDRVFFHGKLFGTDLDEIYTIADVSIGCLGLHRKGVSFSSELKSKESLAKGIPYASGCQIDTFVKNPTSYYCSLPGDETDINISTFGSIL